MKVTVDKFGRILIPKAVRDKFELSAGSELELNISEEGFFVTPVEGDMKIVREGGMVYIAGYSNDIDIVEQIQKDREDRMNRILGLGDDEDEDSDQ